MDHDREKAISLSWRDILGLLEPMFDDINSSPKYPSVTPEMQLKENRHVVSTEVLRTALSWMLSIFLIVVASHSTTEKYIPLIAREILGGLPTLVAGYFTLDAIIGIISYYAAKKKLFSHSTWTE